MKILFEQNLNTHLQNKTKTNIIFNLLITNSKLELSDKDLIL